MSKNPFDTPEAAEAWIKVVQKMHQRSPTPITDNEAEFAAQNLLAFCRLALEICRKRAQNNKHDDH